MRLALKALAHLLLVSSAAPAFAADSAQPSPGFAHSIGNALFGAVVNGVQKDTDRTLVQLQFLNPVHMVILADARCSTYVDLLKTTGHSKHATPADKTNAVLAVARRAEVAGCARPKTAEELWSAEFRLFYQPRRASLFEVPQCLDYGRWADEIAYGRETEDSKRLSLAELFVDAAEKRCSR